MKLTGVIVGNFDKNPLKVPEFCFVGAVRSIFLALRGNQIS